MTELPQIKMQDQHPKKVPLVRTEATATTHARLEHATDAEPKDGGNHCYKYLRLEVENPTVPTGRGNVGSSALRQGGGLYLPQNLSPILSFQLLTCAM